MVTYKTNPNIRCAKCNGRLVIQTDGTSSKVNLYEHNGLHFCKNKVECARNITAEETVYDIIVNNKTLKLKCNGHDVLEVTKK